MGGGTGGLVGTAIDLLNDVDRYRPGKGYETYVGVGDNAFETGPDSIAVSCRTRGLFDLGAGDGAIKDAQADGTGVEPGIHGQASDTYRHGIAACSV